MNYLHGFLGGIVVASLAWGFVAARLTDAQRVLRRELTTYRRALERIESGAPDDIGSAESQSLWDLAIARGALRAWLK